MNDINFQQRLLNVIPGGAHTYSKGFDQFPSNAPQILERGEKAFVWDTNGKRYLDYGMALRSVTLGYAYPSVVDGAYKEILKGNNLTRPSMTELEAAELMVDLIPSADMVKFAKNGSNVTTAAAKIARAYTGRRYICVPRQQPFFSFDDWFIGTTPIKRGILPEYIESTLMFDYGDIGSVEQLFEQYPNQIAGIILEPATTLTPCSSGCTQKLVYEHLSHVCTNRKMNFLQNVQQLCRTNGALFVLDEMITGFRWHPKGAQTYFSVKPDLSTFGKAMGNGFSIAAIVGRRDVMEVGSISQEDTERTFLLSSTHGAEMCGLRAFIETEKTYREKKVCEHLWSYGESLKDGLNVIAKEYGIASHFTVEGPGISFNYVTKDASENTSFKFRTLFCQEMVRHGVLIPWIATSLAHTGAELEITFEAARQALKVYSKALNSNVEQYLEGPAVKPVFRKYN